MNDLMIVNNLKLKMSSLEIAESTGKIHYNVLRDIEIELEDAGLLPSSYEASYIGKDGASAKYYILPKEETFLLLTRYDTKLRWNIIQRWVKLEEENYERVNKELSKAKDLLAIDDKIMYRNLEFNTREKMIQDKEKYLSKREALLERLISNKKYNLNF